jgi:hypothetical protein
MNDVPDRPRTTTALLERADRPGLIYGPVVQQLAPDRFAVVGQKDDASVIPWGFWGGLVAVAAGAVVLAYQGLTGLWAFWNLVWALIPMAFGLILMRFGSRSSLRAEPCAEIDLRTGTLRLLSSTENIALPEVRLDDLTEIVFGMTRYPVSHDRGAVDVDAYSLLVRHASDTLIPVVEVSPDKDSLFAIARFLSRVTGLQIMQVGRGVK